MSTGSGPYLGHWALQFLREKGHVVGQETVSWEGVMKTDVDGVPRRHREAIRIAARYPEWRDRERQHLEYLRNKRTS